MGRSMQELLIFNSFLNNTSDSIVIKEYFANEDGQFTGGKIVCASAVKARHYNLNMDTIRGCTDFDLMPRDQALKALQDDLWVMEHGKPIEDIRETITHKDGEKVNISVTKFPWILPGGELVGVMCIARNITIREKAKQQYHDLKEYMIWDVLKPLIPLYHDDFKSAKSSRVLKAVFFRLIRILNE